mgnify:CR=1 FL=1
MAEPFGKDSALPRIRLDLVLVLVALLLSLGANWALVQAHQRDCNVHHTYQELETHFMGRETVETRLTNIDKSLDRIEKALEENR